RVAQKVVDLARFAIRGKLLAFGGERHDVHLASTEKPTSDEAALQRRRVGARREAAPHSATFRESLERRLARAADRVDAHDLGERGGKARPLGAGERDEAAARLDPRPERVERLRARAPKR